MRHLVRIFFFVAGFFAAVVTLYLSLTRPGTVDSWILWQLVGVVNGITISSWSYGKNPLEAKHART